MKKSKIIILIILLFIIFTISGCFRNEEPEPTSYDIFVMAQESGYEGTYGEWKKIIEGIDDSTIIKVEINSQGELIVTLKNNETKNLGNVKKETAYYTVKFMNLNEQVGEVTVKEGSLIEAPTLEAPEKNVLLGWYFGDDKWRFNMDTVEGDMVLVAKWDKYQENVQPVYQGMSIEKQEVVRSKRFSNGIEKSNIEEAISDYIDIITTEQVEYYAKKGEKFNVVVHIYNPSFYEILSFTLNGRKYQSFEFKDGSDSSKLIIEVDAGMNPGIVEYTIDAIKYVDNTEIKDVRMDGEKTIRAGVQYDVIPNASIISESISTTTYQAILELKDDNQLLTGDSGYFFIYDGQNIVYNTLLNKGINNIKYDNLQMGKNYEYIAIGVFDDYSGVGKVSKPLIYSEFSSLDGYLFKETENGKDFIKVSLDKTDELATIKQVNLLQDNNIISSLSTFDNIGFNNLNSNTEYLVEVVYNYTFESIERENKIYKEFKTIENTTPSFEVTEISSSKYDIRYTVVSSDIDNVLLNKEYVLYLNNEVVKKSNNESDIFNDLLSNNIYQLEIKYTYDLNDGKGPQELVDIKNIETVSLDTPTLNVFANASKNQIIVNKIITDNDNIMNNFNLSVQNEPQVIVNVDEEGNYIITNVESNKQYTIVITYRYNLNDGNGNQEVLKEYNVLTSKEDPNILFTPYAITKNSISYNMIINDKNVVGRVNYIGLYQGGELVKRLDDTTTEINNLNSNTNYEITINYIYDFDDGNGSRELSKTFEFLTLKEEPKYSLEFNNVSKYGFDISHKITDNDNALIFNGVDVLYNNEIVQSVNNIKDISFKNLLSNSEYLVKVKFVKNLNNGDVTVEYKERVTTEALEKPTVDFDAKSSKNSLTFDYKIIDKDNIHQLKDVVVYYKNQVITPDERGVYSNLYSNSNYSIRVTLNNNYNDGSSIQEEVYEYTIKTEALEDIILDIKLESDKKSVSYSHTLTDNDSISTLKEIKLYRGNKLQEKITAFENKTFSNLLSNTLYKVVYVVEKDYRDNTEVKVEEYEQTIKTKALETPVVNMSFTSTRDSILYTLQNVDIDNILNIEKIDVYKGSTLVKTIIDFTSNEINELDANTGYVIKVTYRYNLNDGNDDNIKTISENYSTLADNVSILDSVVLNETAPKTTEDISIKFTLDNKSKVKVDYFVINNEKYPISGGDGYNTAIVIIRSPKMSCTLDLVVEKMGYTTKDAVVEQLVEGLDTLSIDILSRLDLIDIALVNGSNFDKKSYNLGYVLTIDNPDGYVIEKVDDIECEMIDNNHLYLDYFGNYWGYYNKTSISSIYYRDEVNNLCIREYNFSFDMDFALLDVDSDTKALVIKQVSTPLDFMNMKENYIYELVNDIDMNGYAWHPYDFIGYFDGKGHTISNLSYTYESELSNNIMNIFNVSNNATFKNVYFKDIYLNIDCPNQYDSRIIAGYGYIEKILYSGYANYKSNGNAFNAYNSDNTAYIVDHLYVNNEAVTLDKVITEEQFNDSEFKENTLGWNFKTKEVSNYNGILYSVIDNSYIMITGYNGENPEVIIPSSINKLPVVGIEDVAFENNTIITSLKIPSSVLTIGAAILKGCTNIQSVKIDNAYAFRSYNNSDSKDVNLFGKEFISSKLDNLIVNSNKDVTLHFRNIQSVKSIEILGNITLDYNAFENCNNLTNITLSSDIKQINNWAFGNCSSLKNVYYNGSMEDWCKITFIDNLSNPMYYAEHLYFLDSNNEYQELTEIIITNTITEIGDNQFYGFNNINYIIIPEGVTSIGEYAFEGINTDKIVLPKSLKSIGRYNFNSSSDYIFYNGTEEEYQTIAIKDGNQCLKSENYTKYYNSNVTSIDIISNDKYSCFKTSDNRIFDLKWIDKTVVSVDLNTEFEGANVITLAYGAFSNCSSLKSITLPDTLTSIGSYAFYGCTNLTSITIPNGVKEIKNNTFHNCSNLKSIVLPDNVESIGSSAFYSCDALESIIIPEGVSRIESYTFYSCDKLEDVILPDTLTYIGTEAFHYCNSLRFIDISR